MEIKKRYIGIDMSKRSMQIVCIDNEEKVLERMKINNDPEGRMKLIRKLLKNDIIGLETGNSSFLLAHLIQKETKCKVFILNPSRLHIIFKSTKKTDKEDALKIAKLLARLPENELPSVVIPDEDEMYERSSIKENSRLVKMRIQSINALHNLFWNHGITELKRKDLKNKENRSKHIEKIPQRYMNQVKRLNAQIDLLEEQIKEMEEEQLEMNKKNIDYSIISLSVPGIGPKTALAIHAFLGNMDRFESKRQVGFYAGLVPKVDQSGDQCYYGKTTKSGPRELRRLLNQASWSVIRSKTNCDLKLFYDNVKQRCGYKKAIVALSRKMLERIYILHKRKEFYTDFTIKDQSMLCRKLKVYKLIDNDFKLNNSFAS